MSIQTGIVYLIGAGPGDPGLITVKGREILSFADVVVYDRLAHPSLLNYARPDAELIYVGKASAQHAMRQPEINDLLVDRALKGLRVARLKGGDPFVFGRGGEEAERCQESGVPFEVVPGVTSAIAAGAYAGIPITHRDAASSFAVITGHERDDQNTNQKAGTAEGRRNWKNLAWAADTLVFLMGVENLSEISARLIENGRLDTTPIAVVQWGTWQKQRVVTGALSTIVQIVTDAGITSPAVCIVGDVVNLRQRLQWFDDTIRRPMFGKRVLVTRAREQASALSDVLQSLGADPVEFPTIQIVPRDVSEELKSAISRLSTYQWVVFTSANGVSCFANALFAAGLDARALGERLIAAIGPATNEALTKHLGIRADFVPKEAVAEAVLDQWPEGSLEGKSILLPRAAEAREVLPDGLRAMGATVDVIAVYDTVLDTRLSGELRSQLESGELDALTFTSSSTVSNFVKAIGSPEIAELKQLVGSSLVVSIGPITSNTLREFGIEPGIEAKEHTIPGVVAELSSYFSNITTS